MHLRWVAATKAIFAVLAFTATIGWAPAQPRTIVRVHSAGAEHSFSVNNEPVALQELVNLTLEHAIRDNPNMRVMYIYPHARIVICADGGAAPTITGDVRARLRMDGFGNVAIGSATECPPVEP